MTCGTVIAAAIVLVSCVMSAGLAQGLSFRADAAAREKTSARFNGGGCGDITAAKKPGEFCVFEMDEPRIRPIPIQESVIVFVGRVAGRQCYLSGGPNTHLYRDRLAIGRGDSEAKEIADAAPRDAGD